jgi:hypothetical protein
VLVLESRWQAQQQSMMLNLEAYMDENEGKIGEAGRQYL